MRPHTGVRPSRWPWLLSILVILAAVVVAPLTPSRVSVFPLLAAAPLLAAPVYSLWGTIATGAVAQLTGFAEAYAWSEETAFHDYSVQFTSIAVLTVLAAVLNRVIVQGRKELKDTREVAEAVQRAVLPEPPGRIGPLRVASRYRAAAREAAIGGDLYAVHPTSHGVRLMIADVRGSGLSTVRTGNRLLGTFDEAARSLPDLTRVADRLEKLMQGVNNDAEGEGESFATAVLVDVSNDGAGLTMLNLGHPAPLLVHQGRAQPLEPCAASLPLGLAGLGRGPIPVAHHPLPPDAVLVLFTDGLVEARDRHGTFYDPVPFLARHVSPGEEPGEVLDALLADLSRHAHDRLDDDAALLAVARTPGT